MFVSMFSFMTICCRGMALLSIFQMGRAYCSSILGIPQRIAPQALLKEHTQRDSTSKLEILLRSNIPSVIDRTKLPPGTDVLLRFKSKWNNGANRWMKVSVVKTDEHMVLSRKSKPGITKAVSYEAVRLLRKGERPQKIMNDEMADDRHEYHLSNVVSRQDEGDHATIDESAGSDDRKNGARHNEDANTGTEV